jgi:hypothetical protein
VQHAQGDELCRNSLPVFNLLTEQLEHSFEVHLTLSEQVPRVQHAQGDELCRNSLPVFNLLTEQLEHSFEIHLTLSEQVPHVQHAQGDELCRSSLFNIPVPVLLKQLSTSCERWTYREMDFAAIYYFSLLPEQLSMGLRNESPLSSE